ncbi:MAG: DNA methylase [Lachnospiraceae bacterium]|nr:DNA methylase [Lachnospiraceae bacterium]
MPENRTYLAIDLKSFYASVECAERHLDPLTTNLVVADSSRTEKTICLAVSPSLKAHGIPGRPRLFEVIQRVREVNAQRLAAAVRQGKAVPTENGRYSFSSASFDAAALTRDSSLELSYIIAPPRMQLYMDYSTRIYNTYLKYISPEDIHVYSIDEVFMDVTDYLSLYSMTAHELAKTIIREVLYTTGITAAGGIGTNLYLCKVAMDIVAKHVPPDKDGVRIAELDERKYRELLWTHTPLTDFWRVGRGYAGKLEAAGLFTMGDIARCSIGGKNDYHNEELLYKLFGINAELLIDHAWGWEPCTIADIKAYQPESSSLGSGQVLHCPYTFEKAKLVVREMTDSLVLDLVDKRLVTDQLVLTVGYDRESLAPSGTGRNYNGPVTTDHYGRKVPKHAHGTANLSRKCSSTKLIIDAVMELYDRITDKNLLIRRLNITASRVFKEEMAIQTDMFQQLDLFTDYEALEKQRKEEQAALEKEKRLQQAALSIQKKFGKNAILKGTSLQEGATARERNRQIGGHKA